MMTSFGAILCPLNMPSGLMTFLYASSVITSPVGRSTLFSEAIDSEEKMLAWYEKERVKPPGEEPANGEEVRASPPPSPLSPPLSFRQPAGCDTESHACTHRRRSGGALTRG